MKFIYFMLILSNQHKIIYKNQQMKQMSRVSDSQNINMIELLGQQLIKSSEVLADVDGQKQIYSLLQYRQDKIFHFYNNDLNSYFSVIWQHIITENPDFQDIVLGKMGERQNIIYQELVQDKLKIVERAPLIPFDYQEENKINKISLLKLQSDSLRKKINQINNNLQADTSQGQIKDVKDIYAKLYSQQKIKEAEEFVKKNREAQLQRRRKLEEQRKKQEEALLKKEAEIKEQQQEMVKLKKQEILKKQRQLHEKRQKEKQIRQQRNTQYMRIKKSMNNQPPLFEKLYQRYSKRYEQDMNEKMTKMQSERKNFMQNVNSDVILKHEKEYQQLRQKKLKQRLERQQRQMSVDLQYKSRKKVHSSFEIQKFVDPKQVQKQMAKQKLQKMKQYKSIVKQKFKPKVDEEKKRELMNLIQELQLNHKRVKRVRLDNGSIMYEELKPADPKMIGIQYLEQTKQMAQRARERKKQQKDVVQVHSSKQIKKSINYLEQLRKNRPVKERTSFVEKRNMSFDDRVKKVMQQSQKLAEITKQNEMMLKFGKFKTSEQILACKEQIDQNYLNIVNMKLKLILSQKNKEDEQKQSQVSGF